MPKLPRNLRRTRNGLFYFEQDVRGRRFVYPLGRGFNEARRQLPVCRLRAQREAAEEEAARRRMSGPPETFGRFWRERWVPAFRERRSEKNLRVSEHRLATYADPVLETLRLVDTTREHFLRVLAVARAAGLSEQTAVHILADVRCVYRFAEEVAMIPVAPSFVRVMPTVPEAQPQPVPLEHLEAVLAAATDGWREAILVAAATALRYGEQRRLTESRHVVWEPEPILVVEGVSAKSKRSRIVPLTACDDRALEALRGAIQVSRRRTVPSSAIFGWLPERHSAVRWRLRKFCREARVPEFHWHQLRHTATTRLLDLGLSEPAVMAITGHSSVQVLRRYGRRTPDSVRRELDVVRPMRLREMANRMANTPLTVGEDEKASSV